MCFHIKQPTTEAEYKHYYHFRWQQLRAPWNQPRGSEIDDIENQCFHVMAVDDSNNIIGIARLQFNTSSEAQIRYMAVAKLYQKKGVGRALIDAVEQHAKNASCEKIQLNARENAIGFYQKLGYDIAKKSYLLFNEIQHYQMIKKLEHQVF